jgi:hypothetical protein
MTLGGALIPVALLTVIVLALYFGLTRQADDQPADVALIGVWWLLSLKDLISLLRKPSRSLEWRVAVIAKAGWPAVATFLLLEVVGRLLGWNGSLIDALIWIGTLVLVGYVACSFIGERRLLAALRARAASREGPA